MEAGISADGALTRQLDTELRLVQQAILVVASHVAPRVIVGGLRFGAQIMGVARDLAEASGVELVPLWTAEDERIDIRVEMLQP